MGKKGLLILTYIQTLSICLMYSKCNNRCILYDCKYNECKMDDIGCAVNLSSVYSLLKAKEYCNNYPCSKCNYILSRYDINTGCDFIQFLDKIGITSKWHE